MERSFEEHLSAGDKVYPDNPISAAGWLGCVRWAATEPNVCREFFSDTGKTYSRFLAPATPFEAAIDSACGVKQASEEEFADWVSRNFWGENPFTGRRYDGKTDEEVEAMMNGVDADDDTP